MALKDLLVHVDSTEHAEKRLRVAVDLAVRHGARLTGLLAERTTIGSSIVGKRDPDQVAKAAAQARELFDAKVRAAGVPGGWWDVDPRDDAELVNWTVQACRYVDLCVFGAPSGEGDRLPTDLVEEVVYESGRPVLFVPPRMPIERVGDNVLVAWTGSRASARAVADAMPFLELAKEVTIVSLQLPGGDGSGGKAPALDVAAHLEAHGVKARYERFILGELGAVDHVLNRTMDVGADLIVMGAHARHGLPRPKHEDTTGEILRTMTATTLLSH